MDIQLSGQSSNEEFFRMHGTLPTERIEELLDCAATLDNVTERAGHIDEAKAQYPAEDFLTEVIANLQILAGSMRGDKKQSLANIIEELERIETDTRNSAEYGIEELSKLEAVLP